MIKTIPAVTIFICDFCKKENPPRKMGGSVTVEQTGLDWGGNPVANAGFKKDACDNCIGRICTELERLTLPQ